MKLATLVRTTLTVIVSSLSVVAISTSSQANEDLRCAIPMELHYEAKALWAPFFETELTGDVLFTRTQPEQQRIRWYSDNSQRENGKRVEFTVTLIKQLGCADAAVVRVDRSDYLSASEAPVHRSSMTLLIQKEEPLQFGELKGSNFGFPVDIQFGLQL